MSLAFSSLSDFRQLTSGFSILLTPGIKGGVGNDLLAAELTGRNPSFSFAGDTDDLLVGKMGCPHVAYEDITNIAVY